MTATDSQYTTATIDPTLFAPERALARQLIERFGLDPIIDRFIESKGLQGIYEHVLSNELRMTSAVSPRLAGLLAEVRDILHFDADVELFVEPGTHINASAVTSVDASTPHVVSLTSGLIERMNDDELRFVLGHELGHLGHGHYRLQLVWLAFGRDENGESNVPPLLRSRLVSWDRMAELTADRAGFIACGGRLDVALSVFFKLASGLGPEHLRFDIAAFLEQLEDIQRMGRREIMASYSHPITPIRVRALQIYCDAGAQEAPLASLDAVDAEVSKLARLMDHEVSEPLDVCARDFLLAGGMLAAISDGKDITDEQWEYMVNMLLPMSANPEAHLARFESTDEALDLLERSITWLVENTGELRFRLFRELCIIVSIDGVLEAKEEDFLTEVGQAMGIPDASLKDMIRDVVRSVLQATSGNMAFQGIRRHFAGGS